MEHGAWQSKREHIECALLAPKRSINEYIDWDFWSGLRPIYCNFVNAAAQLSSGIWNFVHCFSKMK